MKLDPPAIIEQYVAPAAIRMEKPREFKSPREMYEWAFFNLTNLYKGKDGRTYYRIAHDGTYMSHYVSQYSKHIDDNLEPKIAPVVKALHARKYLTAGSCQGHSYKDQRWVRVLFYNEELRDRFKAAILKSGVPLTFDTTANLNIREPDGSLLDYDDSYLTEMWNALTCRRYEKFYPLKVIIADPNRSLLVRLKHLWFLETYTTRLLDCIKTIEDYPL